MPIAGERTIHATVLMTPPQTTAERVRRLQAEARALALEEVERLAAALAQAARLAQEIADGGEAYPVGVREQARQMVDDLPARAATLKLLASSA